MSMGAGHRSIDEEKRSDTHHGFRTRTTRSVVLLSVLAPMPPMLLLLLVLRPLLQCCA